MTTVTSTTTIMDPGVIDQEREIKVLIRKAEDTGSPTHPQVRSILFPAARQADEVPSRLEKGMPKEIN